ncbi:MAG: hypothetical protein ACREJT_11975 [Myxococcota bacterium]
MKRPTDTIERRFSAALAESVAGGRVLALVFEVTDRGLMYEVERVIGAASGYPRSGTDVLRALAADLRAYADKIDPGPSDA